MNSRLILSLLLWMDYLVVGLAFKMACRGGRWTIHPIAGVRWCSQPGHQRTVNRNYYCLYPHVRQQERNQPRIPVLYGFRDDHEEALLVEQDRLEILKARRKQIRSVLRAAESLRNYRLQKGWVPTLDENGKPIQSDGKVALTFTAVVIAIGAIILRVGGRAALVSTLGLDFMTDNPELKESIDTVLETADSMNIFTKGIVFTLAWTAVKCLCFDAGGVVLALASGILFGGVLQGAVISAAAATVGSLVAFNLAKLDTPLRQKALEILEEYPSLRGIEKTVARDGLKAVLTLRLAPILPIPLGMYNYIYGVTNVNVLQFAGGIFLGSLKPYLLDSYLGYFGKSLVDGNADATGLQDILLLVALGASVLIGVFASQLATETWDSVLEEIEAEKQAKKKSSIDPKTGEPIYLSKEEEEGVANEDDGILREFVGVKVPDSVVGFQYSLKEADQRIRDMVEQEYDAKVWNNTQTTENYPPSALDPSRFPTSPETLEKGKGIDLGASVCDGLVLTPILFEYFMKLSDPLHTEEVGEETMNKADGGVTNGTRISLTSESAGTIDSPEMLLSRLDEMRIRTEARISSIEQSLKEKSL